MKRYFNTKEKAEKHLEYRKACAYKRIEERADKVLIDNSFVFKTRIWKYDEEKHYAYETDIEKWEVNLSIITQSCVDDLSKMKNMDYDAEFRALIPFTEEEKRIRKQLKIEKIEHKYKTLDIKDNTINKDL